jgi:chromosome segregation ATPase
MDTISTKNEGSNPVTVTEVTPQPSGMRQAFPWILSGALALSLGANYMQSQKTTALGTDIGTLRSEMAAVKTTVKNSEDAVARSVKGVEESLEATKQELNKKVTQQTRVVVQRQTNQLDSKWKKEQAEQVEKLNGELAAIRESAQLASTKLTDINNEVGSVKTDVGSVKTEVANTRTELDRTLSDLKRVRGDMGEMSGLIATNSKELNALKELGERSYYEFNLAKSAGQQRVGDIRMNVRKADLKRSRYTLEVVVDDKKIEKKDKTVNEPVQFYVSSKTRQPYELVVYEVQKDRIIGYLATPKVQVARN